MRVRVRDINRIISADCASAFLDVSSETMIELGSVKDVASAMCSVLMANPRFPQSVLVSLARKLLKELKTSQTPPLVNADIGKLASSPPHTEAIFEKMISSVSGGGALIDPREANSTYFPPVLTLALKYMIVRDARCARAWRWRLHGPPLRARLRGPRPPWRHPPRWWRWQWNVGGSSSESTKGFEGATTLALAQAVKDRIEPIGRTMGLGKLKLPNITDSDITSIKRHAWSDMDVNVDDGTSGTGSADAKAVAMGKKEWQNHAKADAYIKTKWGKLGALKRKYLGNTAAAAADATDEADSTGASAGGV